jgi:hypothetical protein
VGGLGRRTNRRGGVEGLGLWCADMVCEHDFDCKDGNGQMKIL